jgi:hypothetical protein
MKGKFGLGLAVLLIGVIAGLGFAVAGGDEKAVVGVEGSAKADKLDACVAPTEFMRKNHFELIMHQRDITVHQGIRKTDNALAGCVECHVRSDHAGNHVPIDAPGEFCAACHEYTGATLDCFTCHATVPVGN